MRHAVIPRATCATSAPPRRVCRPGPGPGGDRRLRPGRPAVGDYPDVVTSSPSRVFVGRLTGLQVFDPTGDQVGRVRDLVILLRPGGRRPRVLGLVIEVLGRRTV